MSITDYSWLPTNKLVVRGHGIFPAHTLILSSSAYTRTLYANASCIRLEIYRNTSCIRASDRFRRIWFSDSFSDRIQSTRNDERTTLCLRLWTLFEEDKLIHGPIRYLLIIYGGKKFKPTISGDNLITHEAQITEQLVVMGFAVREILLLVVAIA